MNNLKPLSLYGIYSMMRDWFIGTPLKDGTPKVSDFTRGSVLRTLMESCGVPIEEFFYRLFVVWPGKNYLANATVDADVDLLVADHTFGKVTRMGSVVAQGTVLVYGAPGTIINSGAQGVGLDNGATYTITQAGQIPANAPSLELTVTATSAGSASNMSPLRPINLNNAISGVTKVTAGARGIGGGADIESNPILKARVPQFFQNLATGTPDAIKAAALSVAGVASIIYRGADPFGGAWTIYVNDGSGSCNDALLNQVYTALAPQKDDEILYFVKPTYPMLVDMGIILHTGPLSADTQTSLISEVQAAIASYLLGLTDAQDLYSDQGLRVIDGVSPLITTSSLQFTGVTYQGIYAIAPNSYISDQGNGITRVARPYPGALIRAGSLSVSIVGG